MAVSTNSPGQWEPADLRPTIGREGMNVSLLYTVAEEGPLEVGLEACIPGLQLGLMRVANEDAPPHGHT